MLVHPGGPFWSNKDSGAWFMPKGELAEGEDPISAARREFCEEIGSEPPSGELLELGVVKNKAGKSIYGWALEGDVDLATFKSNTFALEWPPHSGKIRDFPEVDRAVFFSASEAARKIHTAELPLLERLLLLRSCRS